MSSRSVQSRIRTVPEPLLRALLLALCHDTHVAAKAADYLSSLESLAWDHNTLSAPRSAPAAGSTSRKRKTPPPLEFEHCIQCEQPFVEYDNSSKACKWHPGETEVDYDGDFWADHDENCHGTIDTPEMREEYPEGFQWDCCERLGDEKGCTRGPHRTNTTAHADIPDVDAADAGPDHRLDDLEDDGYASTILDDLNSEDSEASVDYNSYKSAVWYTGVDKVVPGHELLQLTSRAAIVSEAQISALMDKV